MAEEINLKTFTDKRGSLTVIEKVIPFEIKRVFYIYGLDEHARGGHRHKITRQAAVCIQGSCTILNINGNSSETFYLSTPSKLLLLEPEDWHIMSDFTNDAILMVFASEYFDQDDYIFEEW